MDVHVDMTALGFYTISRLLLTLSFQKIFSVKRCRRWRDMNSRIIYSMNEIHLGSSFSNLLLILQTKEDCYFSDEEDENSFSIR